MESQWKEVTNYSDRTPFNNMTLGNKIPPKAVCQLYVFRAVCALFIEREKYMDGETNQNTPCMTDCFLQLAKAFVISLMCIYLCMCSGDPVMSK